MANRSSISGRYISNAAAARHPRTSVTESGSNNSNGTHYRNSGSGRFITGAQAQRNPNGSQAERG
ncbi:ABC transporter ATP-binding protein [Cryobacterium sp. W22_MBD10_FK3]|uniref:ABC transporter ATP-binding protein n=1 Tax=Cryobacterium sp. W22_MBD10_FK3 TaxID=3240273 RepID=UPI003F935F91